MSELNMQNIVSARAHHYPAGEFHGPFSSVRLQDRTGFAVCLIVTREQSEVIAAAFAPKVNEAGVPVYEGRAA
jgi:hypothetical protein